MYSCSFRCGLVSGRRHSSYIRFACLQRLWGVELHLKANALGAGNIQMNGLVPACLIQIFVIQLVYGIAPLLQQIYSTAGYSGQLAVLGYLGVANQIPGFLHILCGGLGLLPCLQGLVCLALNLAADTAGGLDGILQPLHRGAQLMGYLKHIHGNSRFTGSRSVIAGLCLTIVAYQLVICIRFAAGDYNLATAALVRNAP